MPDIRVIMMLQILRNQLCDLRGTREIVARHPDWYPNQLHTYDLRILQTEQLLSNTERYLNA